MNWGCRWMWSSWLWSQFMRQCWWRMRNRCFWWHWFWRCSWPRIFGYRTEFRIELLEKIWHNKRKKNRKGSMPEKGYYWKLIELICLQKCSDFVCKARKITRWGERRKVHEYQKTDSVDSIDSHERIIIFLVFS
jgi:hypothetical protein